MSRFFERARFVLWDRTRFRLLCYPWLRWWIAAAILAVTLAILSAVH